MKTQRNLSHNNQHIYNNTLSQYQKDVIEI